LVAYYCHLRRRSRFWRQPQLANAADAPKGDSDDTVLNEVVVTGSSIRGVAPVGSALIGVTRDAIALQAPANTKELLSSLPQLGNFGANAEQSTSNRFRTAGFQPNIHNLGIYATLDSGQWSPHRSHRW